MINVENFQSLIPQKPPFVMVDKLFSVTETTTTTGFTIQADNIFVKDGVFKEPGLVGYIGAVNNLQVFALPETGDELITEITTENQIFDVTLISGKITCNGQLIAQCKMKIFINQLKNS